MELRHLRYFLAVAEALNFTKAAALLRVAQPAVSRRVQDLEDEIGVDLLKRSPRGVVLTAEGKVFLDKTRHILKLADESVEQVRALARGEEGELHMGYAPAPTVEILPPALAAFQKAFPRIRVLLHDFSEQELIDGLRNGRLELALMPRVAGPQSVGLEFETLRSYPICVAVAPTHRFARLKTITLEMVATEAMIGFNRKDYPEYYVGLDRIFEPLGIKPRVVVECDSSSSLITEIETGRGVAIASPVLRHASGKRLLYRPLTGTTEVLSVGIARAAKGDVTPAGEKFCEILRKSSVGATAAKPKPARSAT
jgi:LysR family transcriptional regulator, benzoate and cis,cis-muconate-responsive activator of ben and cat genes